MKTVYYLPVLLCFVALCASNCRKEEERHVSTDIDLRDPVITTLDNGRKKLDFTIVVTQIGNHFFQDFDLKISRFGSNTVIDSFHTLLPTAREFVRYSIVVDQPGNYWVDIFVGSGGGGSGIGKMVKVPE